MSQPTHAKHVAPPDSVHSANAPNDAHSLNGSNGSNGSSATNHGNAQHPSLSPLCESAVDLRPFNTLALGSMAAGLVRYRTPDQLPDITRLAGNAQKVFVLGGGSNVVLAPELSSLVIKVESTGIRLLHETPELRFVEAEAGESWHGFVTHCVQRGWGGLENLALIPGTVGAAPVQNIGAYGVELGQRFHSLDAWDLQEGRQVSFAPQDCGFSYRDSIFKQAEQGRWLILRVRFALPKQWKPVLRYPDLQNHPGLQPQQAGGITPRDVCDAVCEIRRRKLPDPAVLANAGSFFKNPVVSEPDYQSIQARWPNVVAYPQSDGQWKLAAGWLIEQAGWKGRRQGLVGMHARQALVLVNHGGASADDVDALARQVCHDVLQQFGVHLEQEPVRVF